MSEKKIFNLQTFNKINNTLCHRDYYKNQRIIRLINMLLLTKDCVTHCFKKKYLKPLKRSRYRLKSTYEMKCHFNKRDQLFFSIKMINDFSPEFLLKAFKLLMPILFMVSLSCSNFSFFSQVSE